MPSRPFAAALVLGLLSLASPALAHGAPAELPPAAEAPEENAGRERRARPNREPSVSQMALRERQRKCGAEWREMKAEGKAADGMRWPTFWSRFNARLRGRAI